MLFWDKGPETAPLLKKAGIEEIAVVPDQAARWVDTTGIRVRTANVDAFVKVDAPQVNYHKDVASASAAPWIVSNGWRFLRQPSGQFYYDVTASSASLAAAEAFTYGVRAYVHTDEAGVEAFSELLHFLAQLGQGDFPPIANIGFVDDGTAQSAEVLNLFVRRNLLVKEMKAPEPQVNLTVKLGSKEYPSTEAENPSLFAEKIRSQLTDEKRSLRIYGSYLVIGRLAGTAEHSRVYLLNYGASRGRAQSIRVRVLGSYSKSQAAIHGLTEARLLDYRAETGATEFTVSELKDYAVIDLSK